MNIVFDDRKFMKDMLGVVQYSEGFLEGVQTGKKQFLKEFGKQVIEVLKEYIDSNARVDPAMLQHVYEWYQVGTPHARLFDINYRVNGNGLSFGYQLKQSSSIKNGSSTPFYDKARIMEEGIPVTIKPIKSSVLVFEDNGEEIFTKNPVVIEHPGGLEAQDGFKTTFKGFFKDYFTQAFILASGLSKYLESPIDYKMGFRKATVGGRQEGVRVGIKWIVKAGTLGV